MNALNLDSLETERDLKGKFEWQILWLILYYEVAQTRNFAVVDGVPIGTRPDTAS